MRIDAHQHFWRYDPEQYGWMNDAMRVIQRDFLPEDLKREMVAAGIDKAISVQARQTLEETRALLEFARQYEFIAGVVGWVPLIEPDVGRTLDEFTDYPKLCALRHVLHDESDAFYMLRKDFNAGIRALRGYGLAYDILIFERHLPQTIQFVDQHPDQIFILDHLAKPRVKDDQISPWKENLERLAERPNVYCKISGLVTEADYAKWTEEQLRPYLDVVLSAFGARRTMFGSDWPVCLVAAEYGRWVSIVEKAIGRLSPSEQNRIWSETAIEAYGLVSCPSDFATAPVASRL